MHSLDCKNKSTIQAAESTNQSNLTQAKTKIISSGDSIRGGTKRTVAAGLSVRAILECVGSAFLTSWSLISSGETSSADLCKNFSSFHSK